MRYTDRNVFCDGDLLATACGVPSSLTGKPILLLQRVHGYSDRIVFKQRLPSVSVSPCVDHDVLFRVPVCFESSDARGARSAEQSRPASDKPQTFLAARHRRASPVFGPA